MRFEGRPEDTDPASVQRAAAFPARHVDQPLTAAEIDSVDLAQEGRGVPDTKLAGLAGQDPDVLGQAPAAVPGARLEEAVADARIISQGAAQGHHVRADRLADLREHVYEGDLRRQERIRRQLGQLGGLDVRYHHGRAALDKIRIQFLEYIQGPIRLDAENEPVRADRVGDRMPLPQKFRIPCHLGQFADRSGLANARGQVAGRARGHRRFPGHQAGAPQVRGQAGHGRIDLAEVRSVAIRALWRTDAQEVDIAELGGLDQRGREP